MANVKTFRVGEIGDRTSAPTEYEPSPFKKAQAPEPLQFEVNVVAHAEERQKKTVRFR